MNFLSLNFLIFSPLIAAIVIASPLFGYNPLYIRRFSKTFASLHFLYSLLFVLNQKNNVEPLYTEFTIFGKNWLDSFGINAAFGLDGLTSLLVAFTSLVFLLVLIISKTTIKYKHKMYYTLIFCLLTTTLGIFTSKDIFLFFMFWEAELIPLYLLISEWGAEKSKDSATKYLLFSFTGSIFILAAIIGMYYYGFAANQELSSSIDFLRIYTSDEVCPYYLQILMFLGLLTGFAIKLPLVPFHLWFTEVNEDAEIPVNMVIAAVLVNTGAYGIIKFNLSLFPEIFTKFTPFMMIIAVFTIIWASFAAFNQKHIKKTVAYFSIAQTGIFLLGVASGNKTGIDGAFLMMFAHSMTVAGLYLITGLVYKAAKTYSIQEISGLGKCMPLLMICSYVIIFSAFGLPFTAAFPAEFLIFTGSVCTDLSMIYKILSAVGICGLILISSFVIKLFHGIFCGNLKVQNKRITDIYGHKATATLTIVFCILLLGMFPDTIISIFNSVSENLIEILRV